MAHKNAFIFLILTIAYFQISNATQLNTLDLNKAFADEFECHQSGVFPDPFDCFKYYLCAEQPENTFALAKTEATCSGGFGFDPKNGRCSLILENNVCPQIVPICLFPYQMGPLARDPNLYYVCVQRPGSTTLYPDIYTCPSNFVHDGKTCVDETPELGVNSQGFCIKKGLFYHPLDCTKYRDCAGPGVSPKEVKCAANYKFVSSSGKCEHFDCTNCKN